MGANTVRTGAFIATNKRLVFFATRMFGSYDLEVFPYSNISSIEMGKSLMGHHISFFASGNKATMKWINVGDIPGFVNEVKSRIGKKSETSAANLDIADQIRKLAELKDAGILTQGEFDAKKRQLLGI